MTKSLTKSLTNPRKALIILTGMTVVYLIGFNFFLESSNKRKKKKEKPIAVIDFKYLDHLIKFAHLQYREYLLEMLDIKPHYKMLDIGCGHGVSTNKFAQMLKKSKGGKMVCIEGSQTMINIAKNLSTTLEVNDRITYIPGRVTTQFPIPFKNNSFDISYSNRVLHNTANPEYIFQEMVRVTKPGGKIVVIGEDITTIRTFHLGSVINFAIGKIVPSISSYIAVSYDFIKNIEHTYKKNNLENIKKLTVPIVSIEPYPAHIIENLIEQIPYLPSFIKDYMAEYALEKTKTAVKQGTYYDMVDMIIEYGTKPQGSIDDKSLLEGAD